MRSGGALAALLALIASLVGLSGAPASAHNNGGATAVVRQFTLTPGATGWQANLTLADSDQGTPVRNSAVTLAAGAAPSTMAPSATELGSYSGTLAGAKPGPLHIDLKVRTIPGSDAVNPLNVGYDVNLVSGAPLTIVSGGGGGGGSNVGLIVRVAAAVFVLALLYGLFAVRRRTAVPAAGAQAKVSRA
jgi:hypothetical protein